MSRATLSLQPALTSSDTDSGTWICVPRPHWQCHRFVQNYYEIRESVGFKNVSLAVRSVYCSLHYDRFCYYRCLA